jgi:hypothetical protein
MLMACSAAQAQVSDDAVKIGVLTDHSGGFASPPIIRTRQTLPPR